MSLLAQYFGDFARALGLTTVASLLSFAGALLLGVVIALCRRSNLRLLRSIGTVYVEALRNTPALVQIFIVYFGLRLPALTAGIVALAFNGGAYIAEIMRAGLRAVPPGQLEAAKTLGMGRFDTFWHVIFPQALRFVYPPVINEFMQIILGTSLLSTIGVNELTGQTLIISSITFRTMEAFTIALVAYLILTNIVGMGARLLSRAIFHPPLIPQKSPSRRLAMLGGTS